MNKSNWKGRERQAASFFGALRTPLSGGNSGHGTRADVRHDTLFIEVKTRASMAVVTLAKKVSSLAKLENKIPVLMLAVKGMRGFLL